MRKIDLTTKDSIKENKDEVLDIIKNGSEERTKIIYLDENNVEKAVLLTESVIVKFDKDGVNVTEKVEKEKKKKASEE